MESIMQNVTLKAADQIAAFLKAKNMKHVFGIVGAGNVHIFDAIMRLGFTEIVCTHHEQAAVMAVQAYYRISGIVTAAIVTTGAGSTNAVTGVVGAWMDSFPTLIIAGNENSKFTTPENTLRIWGVQGYNSTQMVERVTKYSQRVMDASHVKGELEKAYYIATSGRPGPCWLEIPMNLQSTPVDENAAVTHEVASTQAPQADNCITDKSIAVSQVIEKLKSAKRPVIWLGQGIRLAAAEHLVKQLVETLNCPALVTWTGIDLIDSNHPLVYGRAGVYGQRSANFVLQNCDFLLTIGTRLALPQVGYDITEFAREAEVAMVDVDGQELQKYPTRITCPIQLDAKVFIETLLSQARTLDFTQQAWIDQCDTYRQKYPFVGPEHDDKDGFINSYRFIEKLNQHFKPDQVVVTDMGTALLSGHQVLKLSEGQRLLTSLGLGEMGYGLPGAIGASFARDKGEVLCLNCDGGMMLNLQELQTIVHHQLPIKIIIFNNDGYLMIKHTQKALFKERRVATDAKTGVSCPDYAALAKAFNIPALSIKTWDDFDHAIPEMQAATGPIICEVFMAPEQPSVPKLSLVIKDDGTLVSPPLEDLSPLLPRAELRENMVVGLHPKSEQLG
jgi:acetolactate synthase I/II/III large subunit